MTPETLSRSPLNPARILVIKLRHHGDMLLITPLIHALKQQYPAAIVDVLLYEETRDMLAANPDIHQIYGLDRRWKKQGKKHQLKMQWQLIQTLRQQRYDMVLNLADQWPSAIISKLTGAATRIGFDFPKRRHPFWRYCHTALAATQQHNQLHTVQQNLSILAPLGIQLNDAPARMGYSEADWATSRALLPEDFRDNYIVIQPTSRWFFKCWREDRMSALINALSAEGYAVVLTSGPDDREKQMVETIIAGCPGAAALFSRSVNAAPAGGGDRSRPAVYRRRLGADAYGSGSRHPAGRPVRPLEADLLASVAGERRGDLGRRLRTAARPGRHQHQHRRTLSRFNSYRRRDRGGEKGTGMSKFRLALVRQKYRPDGGAERFVSRALEALDSSHLQLNVITREWQGPVKPDWQIHICNPRKWGRISRERGFANAARALWQRESFDLVQSHERIPGCDLYRAGDGVHRRWLQQRSRILPAWKSRLLFADRYHRYVMKAEREMYEDPHLRGVICNAEMIKREIIEDFGLPADKIHVIYNAIDNQRFLPPGEDTFAALRAKWQLPLQATCLIYVGSGFERKGLAAAIRAIAPTDRYLLVVGKDKDQPRYQALAKSLNCEARVRFFGMQSETLPFYQMADGLLLPTLYDPFPNVILEAMACGLPVITTTGCGGAEFIVNGHNGYVCDALDIPALQQAVMALPARALGSAEGDRARERIMACTSERLSTQLLSLYQDLVK